MKTYSVAFRSLCIVIVPLFVLCLAAASDQRPLVRAVPIDERPLVRAVPVRENTLPYTGYGEVTIVDDGVLIIEIGGQQTITYGNEGEEIVKTTPWDAIAYRVNTAGLSLVDAKGHMFFDRNGKQLRERGLSPGRVIRTTFPEPAAIDLSAPSNALAWFRGDLSIQLDEASKVLTLQVKDTEATGRVFSLSAPIVDTNAGEGNDSKAGDSIKLVLEQRSGGSTSSECSITCPRGAGAVSCSESGCKCICDSGSPKCICTNSIVAQ